MIHVIELTVKTCRDHDEIAFMREGQLCHDEVRRVEEGKVVVYQWGVGDIVIEPEHLVRLSRIKEV